MKRKTIANGAALATAAALMFVGSAVMAQGSGDTGASGAKTTQVKCVGGNSCKGQSACKSAQHSCKGQNACKGQGYVMTDSQNECDSAKKANTK